MRSGDRAELEGNDIYAESTDKIAAGYSEHPAYADDRGRTESVYGRAVESADAVHQTDQRSDRTVSDGDGNIGGGTDREYQSADNGHRETGWENERELFRESLHASQYGGEQTGEAYEQDVLDISDTFGGVHSAGTDAAYLIGDIGNIIDEGNELAPFKNLFNEWFARDTSKKIRAVIKAKSERGERVGTSVPYGYKRDPDVKGHLFVNEKTAPIIQMIFELFAKDIGPKISVIFFVIKRFLSQHFTDIKRMVYTAPLPTQTHLTIGVRKQIYRSARTDG